MSVKSSRNRTCFHEQKAGLGLLTYEGEAILSYEIIAIQPEKNPLALEISSEHKPPNFTLAVAQMQGNTLHQGPERICRDSRLEYRA